jgi:hypothetical protein
MPVAIKSTGGGSVTLTAPSTASDYTLTLPAATATVATTTGTLTNPTINGFTGDTSVINVGSGQFYKDTSGNVGIGTSSPTGRLDVVGTAGALTNAIVRSSDGYMSRLTLSNTNRNFTISNYGTQFSPNGSLNIADETAGAVVARFGPGQFTDIFGTLRFDSGYGSSAAAYGCRAWVNWNGTNGSIRGSGGVSSVTYNGTSDYTINFSFTMPDANYSAVSMTSKPAVSSGSSGLMCIAENSAPGTTSMRVYNNPSNNGGATQNYTYLHVAVFR